jgi:hypothetical protein
MHRSKRAAANDHRMAPSKPLLPFFANAGEENLAGITFEIHLRKAECGMRNAE